MYRAEDFFLLQWGRSVNAAETPKHCVIKDLRFKLQWGRSVNAAETRVCTRVDWVTLARFNGAAALTLRKPRRVPSPRPRSRRFNGAAALTLRKRARGAGGEGQ